MAYELKVVSGSTNVLLLINGKGVPAQKESIGDEHYRFLIREDRLGEFFPEHDELLDAWANQAKTIYEQFGRIKDLEQLVCDMHSELLIDSKTPLIGEFEHRMRELGVLDDGE